MNIPKITPQYYNRTSLMPQQSRTNLQSNVQDTFLKSSDQVTFGAAMRLNDKFAQFSKEILAYVRKNKSIEMKQIEEILHRFSPETSVAPMSAIPAGSNVTERTGAYYANKILFDNEGTPYLTNKVIYLNIPKNPTKEDTLRFIDDILHETTHIFQQESKDRVSTIQFIEKFLVGKQFDSSVIATLQAMPQAFCIAESNITKPLYVALRNPNNLPQKMPFVSPKQLDMIYTSILPVRSTKEFISLMVDGTLNHLQSISPEKLDLKVLKKYISFCAGLEKEAYQKALQTLKSEMGIKGATDLDLRVMLYEAIENASRV